MQFGWRTHYDSQKKTHDTTTSTQPRPQSSQCLVSDQAQDTPAATRAVQHAARVLIPGKHGKDADKEKGAQGSFFHAPYSGLYSTRVSSKRALRFDTRLLQLLQKKSTAPQACTRSSSAAHCGQWATRVNWWPQAVQGLSP